MCFACVVVVTCAALGTLGCVGGGDNDSKQQRLRLAITSPRPNFQSQNIPLFILLLLNPLCDLDRGILFESTSNKSNASINKYGAHKSLLAGSGERARLCDGRRSNASKSTTPVCVSLDKKSNNDSIYKPETNKQTTPTTTAIPCQCNTSGGIVGLALVVGIVRLRLLRAFRRDFAQQLCFRLGY
jgi:hypothetical protein